MPGEDNVAWMEVKDCCQPSCVGLPVKFKIFVFILFNKRLVTRLNLDLDRSSAILASSILHGLDVDWQICPVSQRTTADDGALARLKNR